MNNPFESYASDWTQYAFPESGARFSSLKDLEETFTAVYLREYPYHAAGLPLAYPREHTAVVNDKTENTLVFGETGSGKSRNVVRPLMYTLAAAGESMIVTDPKGELACDPTLRGILEKRNYRTIFLDFRTFKADRYNIFEHPIRLYCEGKKEKAVESLSHIIHSLTHHSQDPGARLDPFWDAASEELLIPIVHLLLEAYTPTEPEKINMLSVSDFITEHGIETIDEMLEAWYQNFSNPSLTMLRGAISGSEKTTQNIAVSASTLLQPFLVNEGLNRMLSSSTFKIEDAYAARTAVFLIIPDEVSAYNKISGILIDTFYARLIETYTEEYQNQGKKPSHRVNFVCDEFCNMHINDMGPKISACRSRDIRFTLICQSKEQLSQSYPDDSPIILGNCKNILYLESSDPKLWSYISELCGKTYITESGNPEPLVSEGFLRSLSHSYDQREALFIRGSMVCKVILPDCDAFYRECSSFRFPLNGSPVIPDLGCPAVKICTAKEIQNDISRRKIPIPFLGEYIKRKKAPKMNPELKSLVEEYLRQTENKDTPSAEQTKRPVCPDEDGASSADSTSAAISPSGTAEPA